MYNINVICQLKYRFVIPTTYIYNNDIKLLHSIYTAWLESLE